MSNNGYVVPRNDDGTINYDALDYSQITADNVMEVLGLEDRAFEANGADGIDNKNKDGYSFDQRYNIALFLSDPDNIDVAKDIVKNFADNNSRYRQNPDARRMAFDNLLGGQDTNKDYGVDIKAYDINSYTSKYWRHLENQMEQDYNSYKNNTGYYQTYKDIYSKQDLQQIHDHMFDETQDRNAWKNIYPSRPVGADGKPLYDENSINDLITVNGGSAGPGRMTSDPEAYAAYSAFVDYTYMCGKGYENVMRFYDICAGDDGTNNESSRGIAHNLASLSNWKNDGQVEAIDKDVRAAIADASFIEVASKINQYDHYQNLLKLKEDPNVDFSPYQEQFDAYQKQDQLGYFAEVYTLDDQGNLDGARAVIDFTMDYCQEFGIDMPDPRMDDNYQYEGINYTGLKALDNVPDDVLIAAKDAAEKYNHLVNTDIGLDPYADLRKSILSVSTPASDAERDKFRQFDGAANARNEDMAWLIKAGRVTKNDLIKLGYDEDKLTIAMEKVESQISDGGSVQDHVDAIIDKLAKGRGAGIGWGDAALQNAGYGSLTKDVQKAAVVYTPAPKLDPYALDPASYCQAVGLSKPSDSGSYNNYSQHISAMLHGPDGKHYDIQSDEAKAIYAAKLEMEIVQGDFVDADELKDRGFTNEQAVLLAELNEKYASGEEVSFADLPSGSAYLEYFPEMPEENPSPSGEEENPSPSGGEENPSPSGGEENPPSGEIENASEHSAYSNSPFAEGTPEYDKWRRDINVKAALDINKGLYGGGDARREALEAAGYNYDEVQTVVNDLYIRGIDITSENYHPTYADAKSDFSATKPTSESLGYKPDTGASKRLDVPNPYGQIDIALATGKITIDEYNTQRQKIDEAVVSRVIAGEFGNGDARKQALESMGFTYKNADGTGIQNMVDSAIKNETRTVDYNSDSVYAEVYKRFDAMAEAFSNGTGNPEVMSGSLEEYRQMQEAIWDNMSAEMQAVVDKDHYDFDFSNGGKDATWDYGDQ